MEEMKFDNAIKSKLENLESTPPKGTFAAIQNRLKQEPKPAGFIWLPIYKYGLAASVAFVLGLATMSLLDKGNVNLNESSIATIQDLESENINTNTIQEIETNNIKTENSINDKDQLAVDVKTNTELEEKTTNASSTQAKTTFVASNNGEKIEVIPSKTNGSKLTGSQKSSTNNTLEIFNEQDGKVVINVAGVYAAKQLEQEENLQVYALYSLENELEEEKIEIAKVAEDPSVIRFDAKTDKMGYTGFWFGPSISGNHQILGGKNVFGLGLGVDFGYDIKPNFGFQSGFHFKPMIKDVLTYNEQGTPYHDLLDLSHFSIPISLKWKKSYFASNIKRPVSFNAYIGGDYARLTKLDKNQLGAHIGVEYDVFMKPEMMFTVGVRTGMYGLLNYFPEETYLQENYRKLNYAMSLYASLRFITPKKRS